MRRVYFIKPIGMDGPIKIGCSQSPTHRLCDLETWSPFPLELIATMAGDLEIEKRFHAKHYSARRTREWFDPTPQLLEDIRAINAGEFDASTLPSPINLPPRKNLRAPKARAA